MQSWWAFSVVCLGALPLVRCQASSSSVLAELPTCAIKCLSAAIVDSHCSATNQTCMCTTESLQTQVAICVTESCTIKEALLTKNITTTSCQAPIRDKSAGYRALNNALGIVSGVFIVQRFAFKIYCELELGLDDWFTLITLVAGIPSTILTVHGTLANGLGRDIWTVAFPNITQFGMYFYVMEVLYFFQVTLLKLALLFFYLRIFPATPVRRLLWATVIFNCLFGAVFIVVAIFQCKPISYYWTKWDGEHKGQCVSINAVGWSNAGISIALDIWMLAIPMSQLRALSLDWRKKVGVGMMFGVGALYVAPPLLAVLVRLRHVVLTEASSVTVVSILRLRSLVKFGTHSLNPTWEYLDVSKWSTIEINVGIICTCMPSLRLVLVRLFPKLLGTTQRYYANYASNRTPQGKSRDALGTVATSNVDRSQHRTESTTGITCHKTYAVEFGESDETRLVHLRELDYKSSKSDVSV
ncbi:hypothetical protein G7046_g4092 [Stylonectria norvegica]|nr:hypothetical protein G7046_g4092 [Stylonectria norvegica]